jgi:hypothetical protein
MKKTEASIEDLRDDLFKEICTKINSYTDKVIEEKLDINCWFKQLGSICSHLTVAIIENKENDVDQKETLDIISKDIAFIAKQRKVKENRVFFELMK